MSDEEKAAIVRHWDAVMSISQHGQESDDVIREQAQTITDTGAIVSRFQEMASTEARTLQNQLQVAD
jgi:hypothetical protein